MQRWWIRGIERETGRSSEFTIDAEDKQAALAAAGERGYAVEKVKRWPMPPPEHPKPDPSKSIRTRHHRAFLEFMDICLYIVMAFSAVGAALGLISMFNEREDGGAVLVACLGTFLSCGVAMCLVRIGFILADISDRLHEEPAPETSSR